MGGEGGGVGTKIALLFAALMVMLAAGFAVNWLQERQKGAPAKSWQRFLYEETIAVIAILLGFINIAVLSGQVYLWIPLTLIVMLRGATRGTQALKWLVLRHRLARIEERRGLRAYIDLGEKRLHGVLFGVRFAVGLIIFALTCAIVMMTEARSEQAASALLHLQLYTLPLSLMFFNVPLFIKRLLSTTEDDETRAEALFDAVGDLVLIVLPSLLIVYTLHGDVAQVSIPVGNFAVTFHYLVGVGAFLAFIVLAVIPYAIGTLRTARRRTALLTQQRTLYAQITDRLVHRSTYDRADTPEDLRELRKTVQKSVRRLLQRDNQLARLDLYMREKADDDQVESQTWTYLHILDRLRGKDHRIATYAAMREMDDTLASLEKGIADAAPAVEIRLASAGHALSMLHKQMAIDRELLQPDRRPLVIVALATAGTSLWSFGMHEVVKVVYKAIFKLAFDA